MSFDELVENYFSGNYKVIEVTDVNEVIEFIKSKSSNTWGANRLGNTNWYQLSSCSPTKKGGCCLIHVTKLDLYQCAKEKI